MLRLYEGKDDAADGGIHVLVGTTRYRVRAGTSASAVKEMLGSLSYQTYASQDEVTDKGHARCSFMALQGKMPYEPTNKMM